MLLAARPQIADHAPRGEWKAVYQFDRAHNELLDHLVTTGMIGMVLWLGVVGGIVAVGVIRLHAARGALEAGLRLGCLAAVVGQAVEGLVGIASPMPRALFWMAAAILTTPFPMPFGIRVGRSRIPTGCDRPPQPTLAVSGPYRCAEPPSRS